MDYVTNYEGDYDSVFSFSWQKKTINPQETLSLSVVAGADADTSTPPYIKLTKEINERYNKNDKITVQFDVYEFDYQYDNSESVKVYYEFDGKKTLLDEFYPNSVTTKESYSFELNLGTATSHTLKIYGTDHKKWTSNVIEKTLYLIIKPELKDLKLSKSEAQINDEIQISGNVKSGESSVTIIAEFEDRNILYNHDHNSQSDWTPFSFTITVPYVTEFRGYTINVYAKDSNGYTSSRTPLTITIVKPPKTPFETALQTMQETPYETAYLTPYETVFLTPYETAFQTAVETPYER